MKIVTLSGWGQQADSLNIVIPSGARAQNISYVQHGGVKKLFAALKKEKLAPDVLMGWSLGGQIAARLVAQKIVKPKLLVLLSAPYQYVADEKHMEGMNSFMFWTFKQSFRSFPAKTMQQFLLLIAHGDDHTREMVRQLHIDNDNLEQWADWLDELEVFTADDLSFADFPPTLIVHGTADHVVPYAQSEIWHRKIVDSRLELLSLCGHAPHLHAPEKVKKWISEELKKQKK